MSDQPAPPNPPEPSAKPPSPNGARAALPKQQTLTMSQHFFIWALVLVVGVLFGMGSTVNVFKQDVRMVGSIPESDILPRQNTAKKLQDIINPSRRPANYGGGEMFDLGSYEQYAQYIQLARVAEGEGLLPGGAALDKIVKDFLNKPLPHEAGRRYLDAIKEHQEGDKALTEDEIRRYLAERWAVTLLYERNIAPPAVPVSMGDLIVGSFQDHVEIDQVVLDARHLLPTIPDADPEIQTTYDKLRSTRFSRPPACVVTLVYADTKALAEKATIADAEVEKYYNEHKEAYRKPTPPADAAKPDATKPDAAKPETVKPDAPKPPEYKTLAEVTEEIRGILRKQQAEKQAKELVQAFDEGTVKDLVEQKDNVAFKTAAAKQGLLVKEGVLVDEPSSGQLKLSELGDLSESQLHLFSQEVGFLSTAIQSSGGASAWMVLRLDGKREAGYRELKEPEVRKEVIAYLAAQRAYKEFLKQAEAVRAEAEKLGPGGLRKYFASDAAKPWSASVTSASESAMGTVNAPPAEFGGTAGGDGKLYASLALPTAPVALDQAEPDKDAADLPRVKLVQVTGYKPAPPVEGKRREEMAQQYRSFLSSYRQRLFDVELRSRLNHK